MQNSARPVSANHLSYICERKLSNKTKIHNKSSDSDGSIKTPFFSAKGSAKGGSRNGPTDGKELYLPPGYNILDVLKATTEDSSMGF